MNIQKCVIVGCGFVGATCAYVLAESRLFSQLVLIDQNRAKAEGEAMDISDSLPFLSPLRIHAGDYRECEDAALVIIAAGANQKAGESRTELLSRNAAIIESIIDSVTAFTQDAVILMVTNPVDILTYIALKRSKLPHNQVIGSGTVLDTARLKGLLGRHLSVDPRNVHAFVIGEHGDSEVAVWSSANVSGIDLDDFCGICGKCEGMGSMYSLFSFVRDSAYKIIERKGATYYGVAQAVLRIARAIVGDEDSVLTVSTLCTGHYGLEDVCLGVPSIVGRGGVKKVLDIPLDIQENKLLKRSAEELKELYQGLMAGNGV